MKPEQKLSQGKIFAFWYPLALTWLMMAVEMPFLTAFVARLPEPKSNLAAHGVAVAIAIFIEAPVIMIMSASTALSTDRISFIRLRNFAYSLGACLTLLLAALVLTPAMDAITRDLIGLPDPVAHLTTNALAILVPWPFAIGYRRFYQGLLIAGGRTNRVAYGTVVRLSTMAAVGLVLYHGFDIPGAYLSATALSLGVVMEAVASRLMARGVMRGLVARPATGKPITYREIGVFFYPLALTTTMALSVHPMVSFFVGNSPMALESLAVLPVVGALVFIFRAMGISFLEAAIALIGDGYEHRLALRRFASFLAAGTALGLSLIAFTPISNLWFQGVAGLSKELADFAAEPTMILSIFPILSVILPYQRAILVKARRTGPVSVATVIEVALVIIILLAAINLFHLTGAVAAAVALTVGRASGIVYLVRPCGRATKGAEDQ